MPGAVKSKSKPRIMIDGSKEGDILVRGLKKMGIEFVTLYGREIAWETDCIIIRGFENIMTYCDLPAVREELKKEKAASS